MPDHTHTPEELMMLSASDPAITGKMRCYRECEAMLSHYLARGFGPNCEDAEEIANRSVILEGGIGNLEGVGRDELIDLHTLLAKAIAPALPRSIELLHWDAHKSSWNWLAPVAQIRTLIWISFGFFFVLFWTVNQKDLASSYELGLLDPKNANVHLTTFFYISLSGLGACFSVLYDARKYVIDGTFDPRVGSNYPIRIILGVMSGVILAQLLFGEVSVAADGTTTAGGEGRNIGKPIMALLGGFSGQFVYKGLQKLVDSLSLVFSASPKEEAEIREKELRAEFEEKALKERAERSAEEIRLAAELNANKDDPAKSAEIAGKLVDVALGETKKARTTARLGEADEILRQARSVIGLARVMVDVLPDEETASIRGGLSALSRQVDDIEELVGIGKAAEAAALIDDLQDMLRNDDPTAETLLKSVKALIGPATALGILSNPAGMALGIVIGTTEMGLAAHDRWKAMVLDAEYTPDLLPPSLLNETSVRQALALDDNKTFADLVVAAGIDPGDNAALSDLAVLATGDRDDELYARVGGAMPRDAFDREVETFRRSLLESILEVETPAAAVDAVGASQPAGFLAAVNAARKDGVAEAELQKLYLIAEEIRLTNNELADAAIRHVVKRIAREVAG